MTGDSINFESLTQIDGGIVIFGGKDKGRIIDKENIRLGNMVIDVIPLVKGLNHNPVNIGQLCNKGYKINFEEDKCIGISKGKKQSFTCKRYGNIYLLDVNLDAAQYPVSIRDKVDLGYKKLDMRI